MPDDADHHDDTLTPEQVAQLLGVDDSTVRRWIVVGHLPATKLPGRRPRYRVKRADAVALAEQPVQPA